jgi:hypothetical protein
MTLSNHAAPDKYPAGLKVTVVCDATGDENYGGSRTGIWSRTTCGVADYYVDGGRSSQVARWRAPDRVALQPRRPHQLLDLPAGDEVLAPQLRPLLHRNHPSDRLLRVALDDKAWRPPRTSPPTPERVGFCRADGVSVYAAPTSARASWTPNPSSLATDIQVS